MEHLRGATGRIVVVSTGAGVALPFFVLAKVRRVKTVYVEVFDRIDSPTLTGRLCHPFADLFLVQWEAQEKLYRGAGRSGHCCDRGGRKARERSSSSRSGPTTTRSTG